MTYVDSSALVALYVPERFSKAARSAVRRAGQVPFCALHRLEVSNAFELLVGRTAISADERRAIEAHMRDDIDNHHLLPVALDLERVFVEASELSQRYTAKYLTRSLDLLHVAAAHDLHCQTFVSADDRQLSVARATGLAVVDIKRRIRKV